jgi:hypothetical protein
MDDGSRYWAGRPSPAGFFLALQALVARLADGASGKGASHLRREIALLYASRLLFLAFLEAKGWLDADRRFLARTFGECVAKGGRYQRRVLEPLFFGTLNTPPHRRAPFARSLGRIPFLNGGLFTRAPAERLARDLVMRDDDFERRSTGCWSVIDLPRVKRLRRGRKRR